MLAASDWRSPLWLMMKVTRRLCCLPGACQKHPQRRQRAPEVGHTLRRNCSNVARDAIFGPDSAVSGRIGPTFHQFQPTLVNWGQILANIDQALGETGEFWQGPWSLASICQNYAHIDQSVVEFGQMFANAWPKSVDEIAMGSFHGRAQLACNLWVTLLIAIIGPCSAPQCRWNEQV